MITDELLAEARQYCEAKGITPSTLAVRALNNSRFFDRVERQRRLAREASEKLRAFMAENPPTAQEAAE